MRSGRLSREQLLFAFDAQVRHCRREILRRVDTEHPNLAARIAPECIEQRAVVAPDVHHQVFRLQLEPLDQRRGSGSSRWFFNVSDADEIYRYSSNIACGGTCSSSCTCVHS